MDTVSAAVLVLGILVFLFGVAVIVKEMETFERFKKFKELQKSLDDLDIDGSGGVNMADYKALVDKIKKI